MSGPTLWFLVPAMDFLREYYSTLPNRSEERREFDGLVFILYQRLQQYRKGVPSQDEVSFFLNNRAKLWPAWERLVDNTGCCDSLDLDMISYFKSVKFYPGCVVAPDFTSGVKLQRCRTI